ncbi:MAG: hypothetical protein OEZ36_08060, partial [Spirochaetota bacterium]|nr:hypothetical protein [Spirochaetota bacterium]
AFNLLLMSALFFGCLDPNHIEDNEKLGMNEGILYLNMDYLEGSSTFEWLSLTFESLDRTKVFRVKIFQNQKKKVLYRVKEGKYEISYVTARPTTDLASSNNKDKLPEFHGRFVECYFEVHPGVINYLGDMIIQTNRHRLGYKFFLSPPGTRSSITSYFLNTYMDKSLDKLKKENPLLTEAYPLKTQRMLTEKESVAAKEIAKLKDNYSGYGPDTFGEDSQGYGNYKWGMTYDEVRLPLQLKKSKLELGDKIITDKTNPLKTVIYQFSNLGIALWKNRLYKVVEIDHSEESTLKEDMVKKYGNPVKEKKYLVWEIPSTIMKMNQKKGSVTVTYISKDHIKYRKSFSTKG